MLRIVAKFGGTSVADINRIEIAADKILREVELGNEVAVVVSAMSGVTNTLVGYCAEMCEDYDTTEYDTVVSSGEQVTAGLMAIALQKRGIKARSWLGWQVPVECNGSHSVARIRNINAQKMEEGLKKGEVAVLAGFQGISDDGRITTLGRGGSDTTAVALAAALNADRCDIYTDVDGVYTTDPRIVGKARKMDEISYEEMLEMASLGAKVLQTRSVELALKKDVSLQVLSSFNDEIGSDLPGTLVTREEYIMERQMVNGITCSVDEAKITILSIPDVPGVASKIFDTLSKEEINVDMIVQNISYDGKNTDITFTVPEADMKRAVAALENAEIAESAKIKSDPNVVKVSVVGIGMRSHSGVARIMFSALAEKGINIQVISTSEIKISVLIAKEYLELALRTLHTAYGLDDNTGDSANSKEKNGE